MLMIVSTVSFAMTETNNQKDADQVSIENVMQVDFNIDAKINLESFQENSLKLEKLSYICIVEQKRNTMKLEIAQLIQSYNEEEITVHENYSGRNMYGKTTAAVSCDNQTFQETFAELILHETDDDTRRLVAETFMDLKKDSLGLDTIFY